MNFAQIRAGVQKGLDALEEFAPLVGNAAAVLGVPGASAVGAFTKSLAEIAENALAQVDQGVVVAQSDDVAFVKGALARIQAVNDDLDAYIRAS